MITALMPLDMIIVVMLATSTLAIIVVTHELRARTEFATPVTRVGVVGGFRILVVLTYDRIGHGTVYKT